MLINIDSNKYKDMTLASLHMGLIADRFKKRQSIEDLTIKEIIESVGNNGQAFCRAQFYYIILQILSKMTYHHKMALSKRYKKPETLDFSRFPVLLKYVC